MLPEIAAPSSVNSGGRDFPEDAMEVISTGVFTHMLTCIFHSILETKNHLVWFCLMQTLLQNKKTIKPEISLRGKRNQFSRHKFVCVYFLLGVEPRGAFDFCNPHDTDTHMGGWQSSPAAFPHRPYLIDFTLFPLGLEISSIMQELRGWRWGALPKPSHASSIWTWLP